MGLFDRKGKEPFAPTDDTLIVFDDEKKTSDIKPINFIEKGVLFVDGLYKIPVADCEITNAEDGRHFFYRAPSQSILETQRLAALERDTVLKHITSFKIKDEKPVDLTKILLFCMLGLMTIGLIFK